MRIAEMMRMARDLKRSGLALAVGLSLVGGLLLGVWALRDGGGPPQVRASLSVAEALAAGEEGYARAVRPRSFSFPRDHGPHPGFRTEWWYFTGNLSAREGSGAQGRRFGFQLTFFRSQLVPDPPERASPWAADTVYMAHFALTDVDGGRFHAFERFARGAAGLAGARADPFRVWLEDWEAAAAGGGIPPLTLRAREAGIALELELAPGKPPVLHGEEGLSQKGPEPGDASYYYSLTRLPVRGRLTVEDGTFPVAGLAWMDREWSTSSLAPGQVGWDWLSLQLDDGREVMLYQLRREDGSADPRSAGTLVAADGSSRHLDLGERVLQVLERWQSPASGILYPARWRLTLPGEGLDLWIEPVLANQELDLTFRYWEGAVTVAGEAGGRPVRGRGYVELTGYGATEPPGGAYK